MENVTIKTTHLQVAQQSPQVDRIIIGVRTYLIMTVLSHMF